MASHARQLQEAERPILADLEGLGIEVDTIWTLHSHPDLSKAMPVLLQHLHRNYPDELLGVIAATLADAAARPLWNDLRDLYLSTESPFLRDRLGATLGRCAGRANFDDLVQFIHDERLGDTRTYLLRPVNRIGNRIQPGLGRSIVESFAADPRLGAEARAILKGRARND